MDFADILKEWEEGQKKSRLRKPSEKTCGAGRKAQSDRPKAQSSRCASSARNESSGHRRSGENEVRVNPMDFWLRRYGVFDKDKDFERAENKRKYTSAAELKNLPVEAQIDLHGLTREEAWSRLGAFISECSSRRLGTSGRNRRRQRRNLGNNPRQPLPSFSITGGLFFVFSLVTFAYLRYFIDKDSGKNDG